ncbi:PDGLE domain-containing protein [Micromonospora carbonacea]|uniref:PDGLE domain-containing protein n=1 Tax=Micromonospora carbonacea TaxID=47853 RepID=A0A7H8XI17_9ACTN|nr:PDGLE domain-containing protein [Micromonospora carbonacea]MBB5828342.1 cobalt/nickel transport protein [Micromonospora carbonacea]QLD24039.1 PDGLE domain-containing protein [Micromonospora carbonacea]
MSKRPWGFVVGGLLVALLLAGVVSNYASAHPDGLDSSLLRGCTVDAEGEITGGSCPAQQERDHELVDSPLADYGVRGLDNDFLSTGLSGVLGVLLTFAVGGGVFWLLRRRGPQQPAAGAATAEAGGRAAGSPADDASRAARSR